MWAREKERKGVVRQRARIRWSGGKFYRINCKVLQNLRLSRGSSLSCCNKIGPGQLHSTWTGTLQSPHSKIRKRKHWKKVKPILTDEAWRLGGWGNKKSLTLAETNWTPWQELLAIKRPFVIFARPGRANYGIENNPKLAPPHFLASPSFRRLHQCCCYNGHYEFFERFVKSISRFFESDATKFIGGIVVSLQQQQKIKHILIDCLLPSGYLQKSFWSASFV